MITITLNKEDLTFSANAFGYMIFYKEKSIGGAGTEVKKKHWRHRIADMKYYTKIAKMVIRDILNGIIRKDMREAIEKIINES